MRYAPKVKLGNVLYAMQAFSADEIADMVTLTTPGCKANETLLREWPLTVSKNGAEWTGLPAGTPGSEFITTAQRIVRHGWPEGMERFQRQAGEMQVNLPPTRSIRRRGQWAGQGDDLNMERVYGGDLDHAWRRTVRQEGEGSQYVTLTLTWGGSSFYAADAFFWPGAVLVALCDALEEAGRRVTIQVAYAVNTGVTFLRLKEASEPLRLDELLGVVCHTAVYRCLGIGAATVSRTNLGSGYGSVHTPSTDLLQAAADEGLIDEPGILVRGVSAGVSSASAATAEVARILGIVDPGAAMAR